MKNSKVISLLLIALITISTTFVGCNSSTKEGEKSTKYVEPVFDENKTYNLQFAWWGDTKRETATRAALDLWNERYPKIQIEGVSAGWDGYHDKLRIQLLTGKGGYFHIFQFDPLYLRLFAEGERLMDLTPYLSKFEDIGTIDDVLFEDLKFNNNQIYALPSGIGGGILLYNKDTLDKYSIPYPTNKETEQSMIERYRDLVDKARANGDERMWGIMDPLDTSASGYAGLVQSRDVKPWSDNYLDTNLDSEESIKIIEEIGNLAVEGLVVPTDITISTSSEYLDRYSGYSAVPTSATTSTIAQLKSEVGLEVLAGPDEGYTDYRVIGPAIPIAMNARVEEDELLGASLKFLEWFLLSTEAAEKLGFARGVLPSKKQREYVKPTLDSVDSEILRITEEVMALGNKPGQRMPARIAAFDTVFQISKDRYFFQGMSIRDFLIEGSKNGRPELLKGMEEQ